MTDIIQQLRRAIDAKHSEALHALEILAEYLESAPLPQQTVAKPKKRGPRAGKGKIRNVVLPYFRDDFAAVREVVKKTGLATRQVRGVITAPDLKEHFAKREVDGLTYYKFEGPDET